MCDFKNRFSLEQRCSESARIKEKYPGRIPVVIEIKKNSLLPSLDRSKFLVPFDLTVGQLMYVIRKRIALSPEKAIFVFVDDKLPPTSSMVGTVYEENKDDDGFLYCVVGCETVYGVKNN